MQSHLSVSVREGVRDLWQMFTESFLFLNPRNVGSPFEHGNRKRRVFHLLAIFVIAALHAWIIRWVILVFLHPSYYELEHTCGLYPILSLSFIAVATVVFIFVATWVNVHSRLKPVFLKRNFRLPAPNHSGKWLKRYHRTYIVKAMHIVRKLQNQAEEDPELRNEPSEFLRSEYGQAFLRDVVHRVRRLRLRKGRMVRREKWKQLLLGSVISLCCWVAIGGARLKSEQCRSAELMLGFLEIISITLITLVSVCSFLGHAEYVRLVSESLKGHPLTDDEKFLISLLALNTNGTFNGFQRTQDYANVHTEGDVHAFLPMSSWLSVYRESNINFV